MVPFSFAEEEWRLIAGRALYWPRRELLLIADLHLEKASHYAALGQMLPPYDSRETLDQIAQWIRISGARRVICLGDSFHDAEGVLRLEPYAAGMLRALTRSLDWLWITGNHDDALEAARGTVGGEIAPEHCEDGIWLRHEAKSRKDGAEISGHFHPQLRLRQRGRSLRRPCLVATESRLVLPAVGALTGGMDAGDPVITAALQPAARISAHLPANGRMLEFLLWRQAA